MYNKETGNRQKRKEGRAHILPGWKWVGAADSFLAAAELKPEKTEMKRKEDE